MAPVLRIADLVQTSGAGDAVLHIERPDLAIEEARPHDEADVLQN